MGIRTTLIVLALGAAAGAAGWHFGERAYGDLRADICSPLNQIIAFRPDAATRFDQALSSGDDAAALEAADELERFIARCEASAVNADIAQWRLRTDLAKQALAQDRVDVAWTLAQDGPDPVLDPAAAAGGEDVLAFALSPDARIDAALTAGEAGVRLLERVPELGWRTPGDVLSKLAAGLAALGEAGHGDATRAAIESRFAALGLRVADALGAAGLTQTTLPENGAAGLEAYLDALQTQAQPDRAVEAARAFYDALKALPAGEAGFESAAAQQQYRALRERLAHRVVMARSSLLDGATERRSAFEAAIAEALDERRHIESWPLYEDASLAIYRHHLALSDEDSADAVLIETINAAMRRTVSPEDASQVVGTLVARRAFVRGAPRDGVVEDLPYDLCAALGQTGSRACFTFAQAYVRLADANMILPVPGAGGGDVMLMSMLMMRSGEIACAGRFCEREAENIEVSLLFGTTREYDPETVVPSERFGSQDDPDNRGWRGQVTVKAPADALGAPLRYAAVSPVDDRFEPFVIETPEVFGADEQAAARFRQTLADRLDAAGEDAVLVYVHGVNNSFADAARRAAQVSYDLGFEGAPAFYSWPTRRNRWIPSYFSDADFSSAPPADLARFLRELGEEAGTIHLIAHSHGSKLLMQAAGQLRAEGLPLGEVILAAPDVDADDLERDTRTILAPLSERVTIYSNQTDLAIGVSAILRWAGLRGRGRSAEDVDQVDATNVVPIFSHGYFAEEPEVLADIRAVIWHDGLTPAQRCYLAEIPRDEDDADQPPAWRFDTDACDVAAFETASAIAAEVRDDPAFCGPFPELFALVDPRRVYAAGEIGREAPAGADPEEIFFVDDGAGGYTALAEDAAFLAARSFYADVFGGDPERAPCSATAELSADRPARG